MSIDIPSPWQIAESEYDCQHEHVAVVRFTDAIGRPSVRKQCQRCGAHVGDLKKNGYDLDKLPDWNEPLREDWHNHKQQRAADARNDFVAQTQKQHADERAEWSRRYAAYLQSDQWKRVRRQVLERDGYICQNCFCKVAPNTYPVPNRAEVHHLSYDGYNRIGRTFAFECVTLCHKCHREYHGREQGDDE